MTCMCVGQDSTLPKSNPKESAEHMSVDDDPNAVHLYAGSPRATDRRIIAGSTLPPDCLHLNNANFQATDRGHARSKPQTWYGAFPLENLSGLGRLVIEAVTGRTQGVAYNELVYKSEGDRASE